MKKLFSFIKFLTTLLIRCQKFVLVFFIYPKFWKIFCFGLACVIDLNISIICFICLFCCDCMMMVSVIINGQFVQLLHLTLLQYQGDHLGSQEVALRHWRWQVLAWLHAWRGQHCDHTMMVSVIIVSWFVDKNCQWRWQWMCVSTVK